MNDLSQIDIFPFVLIRMSGFSIQNFNQLHSKPIFVICNEIINLDSELIAKQQELSFLLHEFNQLQTDKKIQNIVQNFRRDIHNGRTLRTKSINAVFNIVSDFQEKKILQYSDLLNRKDNLLKQFNSIYIDELKLKREILKEVTKNEILLKGLSLASITLVKQLKKQESQTIEFKGKFNKMELSLIKYLSRASLKTSPFSTFTLTNFATLLENNQFIEIKNEELTIKSEVNITINNLIFYLILSLLKNHFEVYSQLPIKINSTISFENNIYKYFINQNNHESIKSIHSNNSLKSIFDFLKEKNKEINFLDLIKYCKTIIEAEEQNIINFLNNLLNEGFIEFDIRISPLDSNWAYTLNQYIKSRFNTYNSQILTETIDILNSLMSYKAKFVDSNSNDRVNILEEINLLLITYFEKHQKENNLVNNEKYSSLINSNLYKLFYEDIKFKHEIIIDNKYTKTVVENFHEFVSAFYDLDYFALKRKELYNFFCSIYGIQDEVKLIDFYEEYYKLNYSENIESEFTIQHNILKEKFQEYEDYGDVIVIKRIQNDNSKINRNITSFCSFFQISDLEADGNLTAVLNSLSIGYGKMFSRFLNNDLNSKIFKEFKIANTKYSESFINAEVQDGSYFNANIHPPLMNFEIKFPGVNSNFNEEFQIPINDIYLKADINENEIFLFSKNHGSPLNIFDLGFQIRHERSELYKLLSNFTLAKSIPIKSTFQIFNKVQHKENITIEPRIIYKNIVLQRKSWRINISEGQIYALSKTNKEDDANYYIRINKWRKENQIPEEIFVTLESETNGNNKPQYVNFTNIFLVKILADLFLHVKNQIVLTEMLPSSSNQIFEFKEKNFVSEYVIQWNGF